MYFFCQTCREDDRRQISAIALLAQVVTLILRCDRPVVGPSALRHTPSRAGVNDYFDGPRSRAEGFR